MPASHDLVAGRLSFRLIIQGVASVPLLLDGWQYSAISIANASLAHTR
jgi:hypothetical protein